MKNIRSILYASVAIVATSLASCNKLLEEENPGGATAEDVWKSPQGFVTAVNSAYNTQRDWYGKEDGMFMAETGSDLWINRDNGAYANQNTRYEGLSPSAGNFPRNAWAPLWRGINQCNAGIGRIDDAGFTDQGEKNRRLGELRFLRGFYYWHIVETWGGVMLRTKETDSLELYAYRSPVSDFYNLIIEDLTFAKDNLPVTWAGEKGRAAKKAAIGMLARAYLSRAYYYPAGSTEANNYFTKAKELANDLITNATAYDCKLNTNVLDLWKNAAANNKTNPEALYSITWSANNLSANNTPQGNITHSIYIINYPGKPGLARSVDYGRENDRRLMPTRFLVDLFVDGDARYEASFTEEWKANTNYIWSNADATTYQKDVTAVVPGVTTIPVGATALVATRAVVSDVDKKTKPYVVYDRNTIWDVDGKVKVQANTVFLYPQMRKFIDMNRPAASPDANVGYNDVAVLRLAEMYLIVAEAEWKLNNPTAAADAIAKLRVRSTKAGKEASMVVTPAMISTDFILDERAREFCGEWIRWFDLKRMLTGDEFVARIKARNPHITAVQPFHRLRPIRLEELNSLKNGVEFGQNLGY